MITSVEPYSRIYNAVDKPDHGRGHVVKPNGRIIRSKKSCLIYSVIRIDGEYAVCQSWDRFGKQFDERILLKNLDPWGPKKRDNDSTW